MAALPRTLVPAGRALALDVAAQALVVVPRLATAAAMTTRIGMLETVVS